MLTDVGVDMPWQAAEPSLDRIHRLNRAGEIPALDYLFDEAELFVGRRGLAIPNCDSCRDNGYPDLVRAQLLERGIGIHRLVMRVGIEKGRSLVGYHLLQDRGYRLSFGEPLPPDPGQEFRGIRLVEHDRAGRPTISERQAVQVVENPGRGRRRETYNGQDAQMR